MIGRTEGGIVKMTKLQKQEVGKNHDFPCPERTEEIEKAMFMYMCNKQIITSCLIISLNSTGNFCY